MSLYPEDVPFEIVKEGWSTYDLGDGCVLRITVILGKILKPAGVALEKVKELIFSHQVFMAIYAPLEKKGTPETRELSKALLQKSIVKDIDPKPINTTVNEYVLENKTIIRLRLMLTRVMLTDKFTADSSPAYLVSHQIAPQIISQKPTRPPSRKRKDVV